MLLQTQYFISQIFFTSTNIKKMSKIEKLISVFRNQTFDSSKFITFFKIFKVVRHIIVDKIILNYTNTKLLIAHIWKKQQVQHTYLQYVS